MAICGPFLSDEGQRIADKIKVVQNEFEFQSLKVAYFHKEILQKIEELLPTLKEEDKKILLRKLEATNAKINSVLQVTFSDYVRF